LNDYEKTAKNIYLEDLRWSYQSPWHEVHGGSCVAPKIKTGEDHAPNEYEAMIES